MWSPIVPCRSIDFGLILIGSAEEVRVGIWSIALSLVVLTSVAIEVESDMSEST